MKKAFLLSLFLCASLFPCQPSIIRRRWLPRGPGSGTGLDPAHEFQQQCVCEDITHDDEGNVYICGSYKKNLLINPDVSFPVYKYNSGNNGYLMKYTKEGSCCGSMTSAVTTLSINPSFLPIHNGQLVMYACANGYAGPVWTRRFCPGHNPKNNHEQELFIKFDIQTGKKLDVESVTNTFLYGYTTSDSEGNLYLLADYEKGCQGLNDGRLHSVSLTRVPKAIMWPG